MPAEVSVGLLALPLSRRRCRRQPLQSHRFAFCGADSDRLLLLLCAGRFQGAGECASTCLARSTRCRRGRHPGSLEGPACRRFDCSRCPSKRGPSKRGPCCSCPRQPRRQRQQHGSAGPRRSGGSCQGAGGSGAWTCCCHGRSCHSCAPTGAAGGQGSACWCARQGDCGAVRLTDRHSTGGRRRAYS